MPKTRQDNQRLTMALGQALGVGASTAPQDIALQDAASFHIYRLLRADILNCRLEPGARLRFEVLASAVPGWGWNAERGVVSPGV